MSQELATRAVPWEVCEVSHARNRPAAERPPLPVVGQRVYYRRHDWSPDVHLAEVLEVQDLQDRSDPNLWHQVKDIHGQPVHDAGVPRYARCADPWPWLRLAGEWPDDPDGEPYRREAVTWEARLRGSAGWLPLDWATRPERCRLPGRTLLVPKPALPPLNVPYPAPADMTTGR